MGGRSSLQHCLQQCSCRAGPWPLPGAAGRGAQGCFALQQRVWGLSPGEETPGERGSAARLFSRGIGNSLPALKSRMCRSSGTVFSRPIFGRKVWIRHKVDLTEG